MNVTRQLRTIVRVAMVEATNMDVASERDLKRRIEMLKVWINDPATPRSQREQHSLRIAELKKQLRAVKSKDATK